MTGQNRQETAVDRSNTSVQQQKANMELHALSRRSLWKILLFILISIAALQLRDFDLLAAAPDGVRNFLGSPPPTYLVTIALAIYGFSATVIVLSQLANEAKPLLKWSHLGYRSVFYFFYAVSGTLANHFLAVFFIGFFLYGAEQVLVWIYANRVEQRNNELLSER